MDYKVEYDKNFLMHHGVKGQKWGEKNGPPYPLSDKVKSIAYRGGYDAEGNKKYKIDKKDVKEARNIVDKNLKYMSNKDLNEYKNRLILENSIEDITGKNWYKKEGKRARDNIAHMFSDASTQTGKNLIANVEMFGIAQGLSQTPLDNNVINALTKINLDTDKKDDNYWFTKDFNDGSDEIKKNKEYEKHMKDMGG